LQSIPTYVITVPEQTTHCDITALCVALHSKKSWQSCSHNCLHH